MITLKLSPFKKILMSLLVTMLNATYHISASAYSILTTANTTSCESYCKSRGYVFGHPLNCLVGISVELHSGLVSYYANSNGKCLCLNSMERQALTNCGTRKPCSTYGVSNASSGYRDHVLTTANSFNCASGYGRCYCKTGYYAKNQSCVICPTGYKCTGGQLVSVGLSTTKGSTVCPMGYYQSRTGQSTCTACSPGTYNAGTARSTCYSCGIGQYQSQAGKSTCSYCPRTDNAESIQGATSSQGATSIYACFVPGDYTFTENDTGHKYEFTSDCYYAS